MSLAFSEAALNGITVLPDSGVQFFTATPRLKEAAFPSKHNARKIAGDRFEKAFIPTPGFPLIFIPRAFVDPKAIDRESKPANFRKSHKRIRRRIAKEMAKYGVKK